MGSPWNQIKLVPLSLQSVLMGCAGEHSESLWPDSPSCSPRPRLACPEREAVSPGPSLPEGHFLYTAVAQTLVTIKITTGALRGARPRLQLRQIQSLFGWDPGDTQAQSAWEPLPVCFSPSWFMHLCSFDRGRLKLKIKNFQQTSKPCHQLECNLHPSLCS